MDLHVLRSPESENHIFSVWSVCMCVCICVCVSVCVSLCVCVCVCYQHNSKTNNSRNIKFGILYLYHMQMLLKTFYDYRTNSLCTRALKIILLHYGLWTEFLVGVFY